jgi:hypothetical protein
MKIIILITLLLISPVLTQDLQKILHLKDGSQISGVIIEESPGDYVKLYNGASIQKISLITIERISSVNNYTLQTSSPIQIPIPIYQSPVPPIVAVPQVKRDISTKSWSVTVGPNFGNFFTIKKEIKFSQNAGAHLSFGYPHAVGIGFSSESRYNQNGTKFSTLIGYNILDADYDTNSPVTAASSLAYQWRMGSSSSFLSLGLMLSTSADEIMQLSPVFSFDIRM